MGEAIDAEGCRGSVSVASIGRVKVEALELDPDEYLGCAALSPTPTHLITQATRHSLVIFSNCVLLLLSSNPSLMCCVITEHTVLFQGKQCNFLPRYIMYGS
jgi:hypothetical protein